MLTVNMEQWKNLYETPLPALSELVNSTEAHTKP